MHKYTSRDVVCPFYTWEDEHRRIHHEPFNSGSNVILSFNSNEKFKEYQKKYCNNIKGYQSCPLAKAMAEKHGGF